MPGPENGILGDQAFPTQLPQTEVPQQDLTRERSMAKFSQSEEFKALKEAIESRIEFYQQFVPGGAAGDVDVKSLPNDERGWRWLAADNIIMEFRSILNAYEQAAEAVKMQIPEEKELKQYDRWGVARPSHEEHGEYDPSKFILSKPTAGG